MPLPEPSCVIVILGFPLNIFRNFGVWNNEKIMTECGRKCAVGSVLGLNNTIYHGRIIFARGPLDKGRVDSYSLGTEAMDFYYRLRNGQVLRE
jgi:hypothetical protein